ncbi:hypothetical protein [Stenotrophomonas sp. G106K1]|uniref:hypothetical protein n=1 Tax=Stenotrophomonas sp. G106K1 TaxID=3134792 RepID=UPI0030F423BF
MTSEKNTIPATQATVKHGGCVQLGDGLLPCPFCGERAERIDFGPGSGDNEGGSCVACTVCQHSGPVEFGYKENFISNWNRRALAAQPSPGGQDALALPGIVREVLAWYASNPTIWVAWNEKGWAEEEAAKASGHYTCIGDYRDGHMEYVPNEVRAEQALIALDEWLAALAARQPVGEQHPDDLAVDAFAAAMKAKMAEARAKGRGGWEDPAQCSADDLSRMLREHVEKGDPRDVANFCMMLHQRGEAIAARQTVGQEAGRIQGDMVDGELSVASAIARVLELFPSADRSALRTLAACFTHHSIYRYAAPPAQQPAQVYLDGLDRALGEAIDQRDRYHEVADELADHIARITGVDIGEHSSANCPWQNAIEAAEAYQPAQAVDLGRDDSEALLHIKTAPEPVSQPSEEWVEQYVQWHDEGRRVMRRADRG